MRSSSRTLSTPRRRSSSLSKLDDKKAGTSLFPYYMVIAIVATMLVASLELCIRVVASAQPSKYPSTKTIKMLKRKAAFALTSQLLFLPCFLFILYMDRVNDNEIRMISNRVYMVIGGMWFIVALTTILILSKSFPKDTDMLKMVNAMSWISILALLSIIIYYSVDMYRHW